MNSGVVKRKVKPIDVFGMSVLFVSVISIMFGGLGSVTTKSINLKLQQLDTYLGGESERAGKISKLSYGNVALHGFGNGEYATVDKVIIQFSDKSGPEAKTWSLSTPQILVMPDPLSLSRVIYTFPEPIKISENDVPKAVVTFPAPLRLGVFDGKVKKVHTQIQALHIPTPFTIMPVGGGAQIAVDFDNATQMVVKTRPDSGEREETYQFRGVTVDVGNIRKMTIGSINNLLNEKIDQDHHLQGQYSFAFSDVSIHSGDKAPKTYSLSANVDYSVDKPLIVLGGLIGEKGNIDGKLSKFMLISDDFKIEADGDFARALDDPLPNGHINISINGIKSFLSSDLIPEALRASFLSSMMKVTGKPVDSLTDVSIPVKREKNGGIMIGNATFEELATSMLTDMVSPGAKTVAAPVVLTTASSPATAGKPDAAKPNAVQESPVAAKPDSSSPDNALTESPTQEPAASEAASGYNDSTVTASEPAQATDVLKAPHP